MKKGGITVDRELICPAATHPKFVVAVGCQGSCLGRVIDSDEHGLHYGPGDALGLPIHYGKTVQLNGMTCDEGTVIKRGMSS